ncbi:hypothetical protein TYRP_004237 [Tyrophagus putrescentiae]|nr:hypothetical protein TYRP_004237 [Tyrophagus putrescentiae]
MAQGSESKDKGSGTARNGATKRPAMMGAHWQPPPDLPKQYQHLPKQSKAEPTDFPLNKRNSAPTPICAGAAQARHKGYL